MTISNLEYKYCCGCGLCSKEIPGIIDDRGYYRPDKTKFSAKFDTTVCYCNQLNVNITRNKLWGNIYQAYFGYSNNDEIRQLGSSGGMLTAITSYLLDSKEIDVVIQIKANKDNQMKSEVVWNSNSSEVLECSGSRYTASASLKDLLERIDIKKKYAIVGKPCDIRVLRSYMEIHPDFNKYILYLLTFFCGGTPSKQANTSLLNRMSLNYEGLESFTYRGNGWPGKTIGVEENGKIAEIEYEKSWGEVLGRDLQEVCRFCWEGTGEAADISCGDGWYIENGKPSFEERPGRNIIFARNDKSQKLLKKLNAEKLISLEEINDLSVMKDIQPGQYMRKGAMFARVLAMKIMGKSTPKYESVTLLSYSKYLSFRVNVKMFGGTIKRIINGKIL